MQFDNLCKYLAEKYPVQFASWLLDEPTTRVEVLKTELSLEPIRADSVTLAPLCAAQDSTQLLYRVAQEISNIEETEQRQDIAACTQVFAGLRFSKSLIRNLFREEVMRESVIFQDILEEGRQEEATIVVMRQQTRFLGTINPDLQARIQKLTTAQLENLIEASLDFSSGSDLIAWLEQQGK